MIGALVVVTAPTVEPLTLAEAKAHLRVTAVDENDLITSYIATARQHLDGQYGWMGRAFCSQTWDYKLDAFPCVIRPPLSPIQSVTSIKYLDTAGDEQTLATAKYRSDLVTEPARITEAYGETWPSTYDVTNAVTVRIVAGWTSAALVPEPIKLAMRLLIAHWYGNREAFLEGAVAKDVDAALARLLMPLRVWA